VRELARGATTQARVVYALALRETRTRFGKHQLGYVWALLEPAFFIGTFWAMFAAVDRTTPMGMEIVPFLATGIIPYSIAIKTADKVSLAVDANKAMLFYPHVQPLDLVLARGLLELTTYLVVFVVILGGYSLATQTFVIDDVLTIFSGLMLAALLGVTLGTLLCALTVVNNAVQRIKGPLMRPLFWTSGLFFAAAMIPLKYREYLLWNPVLHCTEIVRDGWFPQYTAADASPSYVMLWIVLLAFGGLTLERRVRTKVQLT
jgi:capsular polysaccharide transport system permease protein